ncbi:hypothetical protein Dimus_033809, partial [Dionaea muscipula]
MMEFTEKKMVSVRKDLPSPLSLLCLSVFRGTSKRHLDEATMCLMTLMRANLWV